MQLRSLSAAAVGVGLLIGINAAATARAQDAPIVAAASDLQFALSEVAKAFTAETEREVKLAFGSSGNFARQIEQGAPFQIFFSADEQFALDLVARGLTADAGTIYAVGRLVVIAPHGSPLKTDGDFAGLKQALVNGEIRRFAIANPEHAPYGARAEEALRQAGLWDAIKDKLIFGENVSQAAQFAISGSAQGGIVAYSLARAPDVAKLGTYALISGELHEPLKQRVVLMKGAGETARSFYEFMQGANARAILRRWGFLLPGESS